MTEAEWLACTDPERMLAFLKGAASDRRCRLFACACCRRVWHQMTSDRSQHAVEASERFADGECDTAALQRAQRAANAVCNSYRYRDGDVAWSQAPAASSVALVDARTAAVRSSSEIRGPAGKGSRGQVRLLRDIFGNPFRPAVVEPPWRTPTVLALAQAAYDDRLLPAGTFDLDRLAVLSDALEDAGCDSADILSHLRGPGPHVRGCWVVDLLLGKG